MRQRITRRQLCPMRQRITRRRLCLLRQRIAGRQLRFMRRVSCTASLAMRCVSCAASLVLCAATACRQLCPYAGQAGHRFRLRNGSLLEVNASLFANRCVRNVCKVLPASAFEILAHKKLDMHTLRFYSGINIKETDSH